MIAGGDGTVSGESLSSREGDLVVEEEPNRPRDRNQLLLQAVDTMGGNVHAMVHLAPFLKHFCTPHQNPRLSFSRLMSVWLSYSWSRRGLGYMSGTSVLREEAERAMG